MAHNLSFKSIDKARIYFKEKALPLFIDEVDHSPTGFSWGYGGSGPSQSAYAILRTALAEYFDGNETKAVFYAKRLYQRFKWDFIAKIDMNKDFILEYTKVEYWFKNVDKDDIDKDWELEEKCEDDFYALQCDEILMKIKEVCPETKKWRVERDRIFYEEFGKKHVILCNGNSVKDTLINFFKRISNG